jgi:two-component sensor histidine kinase
VRDTPSPEADAGRPVLLVLEPRGRDAETVSTVLERAGLSCEVGAGIAQLVAAVRDGGIGVGVVAEETLRGPDLDGLRAALADQPPWSDMPLVVLTRGATRAQRDPYAAGLAETLGNAVFLERPLRAATLVAAVRSALRGRRRQIQLRDNLAERDRAARRQAMLLHELNHRVKNTLATVQAIAGQTLRHDSDPEKARQVFLARLLALSKTHDLLTASGWTGSDVREVVAAELVPFRDESRPARVTLDGPPVQLAPNATVSLGMAIHELVTNAVKYGALSVPGGSVAVAWSVRSEQRNGEAKRRLHLSWQERGGPPVAPPARRGFGSRLIERGLARELGGTARIDFAPEGVRCAMDLALGGAVAFDAERYRGVGAA